MFELPKLNYPKNALTPAMSEETLDLHHGKHHQTYITNLNNLIKDTPLAKNSLEEIVKQTAKDASKAAIFNNAGQHWNHILFWNCMKPKGGGAMPSTLEKRIIADFGSVEKFKEDFIQSIKKEVNITYSVRDYDRYCWQFATKGFFKFKEQIPKVLAKFLT